MLIYTSAFSQLKKHFLYVIVMFMQRFISNDQNVIYICWAEFIKKISQSLINVSLKSA